MSILTWKSISLSSDDELLALLDKALESRIPAARTSAEFLPQIRGLPPGLRAMAATYELDVSLTMDDLGWHFGNWHDEELAKETARGLEVLGATELARIFCDALCQASKYWRELERDDWPEWYHGSPLETAVATLNEQAWTILDQCKMGIFDYWVDYARKHPEGLGVPRMHDDGN